MSFLRKILHRKIQWVLLTSISSHLYENAGEVTSWLIQSKCKHRYATQIVATLCVRESQGQAAHLFLGISH